MPCMEQDRPLRDVSSRNHDSSPCFPISSFSLSDTMMCFYTVPSDLYFSKD